MNALGIDARDARRSEELSNLWAAIFEAPLHIQDAACGEAVLPQRAASGERVDAAASSAARAESVSVIVRGEQVGIVVRDARLEPHAALQAAFVVAQDLTGRRDALRLLMVNGRTLYRLDDGARTPAPLIRC